MAGIPVKLTFDPSYPDHAKALELLRAQKHTTQFVVNLILGAAGITEQPPPTGNRQVTRVTEELPNGNLQVTRVTEGLPKGNLQVTRVTEGTTLEDIPKDYFEFIEGD